MSDKIKIEISKVLYDNGWKPFHVSCDTHRIKRKTNQGLNVFNTLRDVKEFYCIDKLVKTDRIGWAVSSRGKMFEWPVYEAEISADYLT